METPERVVFVGKRYAVRENKKWRYAVSKAKIGRYAVRKGVGGVTLIMGISCLFYLCFVYCMSSKGARSRCMWGIFHYYYLNRFNKIEAAISICQPCLLGTFFYIRLMQITTAGIAQLIIPDLTFMQEYIICQLRKFS